MSSPEYIITEKWSSSKYAILIAGIVLAVAVLLSSGYYLGSSHSLELIDENEKLSMELNRATEHNKTLEERVIMQEQLNRVEQAANAEAGQSLDSKMLEIRELERELTFYRNILAPEESQRGLQISQFSQQIDNNGKVLWQVSLLQAGSQGTMLSGLATVDLIYQNNGTEERMEIVNASGNREFGFRFRYFQHLTGELELVDEIIPVALEVTARQYGTNSTPITKRFDWVQPIEEAMANVGQ